MVFEAIHSWTLAGLMEAFVDLGIAYFLLWISAFAFLPCKVLNVLGLCRPCPCSGNFGCQNSNLFLHKVLIDWPTAQISYVQDLVRSRFPFDLILLKDQSSHLRMEEVGDRKCEIRAMGLEEHCSSSVPRLQDSVNVENGYDAKGKRNLNQKSKSGIRRRKKAHLGFGKLPPALCFNTSSSVSIGVADAPHDVSDMRTEISESFDPASGIEDGFRGDGNAPNDINVRSNLESNESLGRGEGVRESSLFGENVTCNFEDSPRFVENNANTIRMLEQALAEEKATHAVLYQELEKERAAAASAADEAMAMILRLQEEKASVIMELRQYQRMIEETFNHDEEEMDILKEIIVRRERENHSLLMELETYRQTNHSEYEQPEDYSSYILNHIGRRPALSVNSRENQLLMMQQIENDRSTGGEELKTNVSDSTHERGHKTNLGKEMMSNHEELAADLTTLEDLELKTSDFLAKERVERSSSSISQGVGEGIEKKVKLWNQLDGDVHGSMLDMESTIYDVHVIDDHTIIRKNDTEKESGEPLSNFVVDPVVCSDDISSNTPSSSMTEIVFNANGSYLDSRSELPGMGDAQCRSLKVDSMGKSSCVVNSERIKIDPEVEWLRQRLRIVQEETEKLNFSTEPRERIYLQLKLVEGMVKQLQDIEQLRAPLQ